MTEIDRESPVRQQRSFVKRAQDFAKRANEFVKRASKNTRHITQTASALLLAFGTAYGLYEYSASVQQSKVDRSFEYFRAYSSGEIADARSEIWSTIEGAIKEYNEAKRKHAAFVANAPPFVKAALSKLSITGGLDGYLISRMSEWPDHFSMDLIVEYFDSVQKCVDNDGCDECMIDSLLRERARELFNLVAPVIQHRVDRGEHEYGQAWEAMAVRQPLSHC